MKILGSFNQDIKSKIRQEQMYRDLTGKRCRHQESNTKGKRVIEFVEEIKK